MSYHRLLLLPLALVASICLAQGNFKDCNPTKYTLIFNEASALQEKGAFIDAKNRYEAAKIYACNQKAKDAADKAVDKLFEQIEFLRQKSDALISYFSFSEDRAWAYKNGKFALIDSSDANLWTPFIFDEPEPFRTDGLSIAKKNGLYCFVRKNGEVLEGFDHIYPTNNGWYKIRKEGKETFFDSRLKPAINFRLYDQIGPFVNGKSKVVLNGQDAIVDSAGNVIVGPSRTKIHIEGNVATSDGFIYYLDSGKKIKSKYKNIVPTPFSTNIFSVLKEQDFTESIELMLVNAEGEVICEGDIKGYTKDNSVLTWISFARMNDGYYQALNTQTGKILFERGAAMREVLENGNEWIDFGKNWALIDSLGNFIIKPQFSEIKIDYKHKIAWVFDKDDRCGLYDFDGNELFPPILQSEGASHYRDFEFEDSIAVAILNDKHIAFNTRGKILLEMNKEEYDAIDHFSDGVAWARKKEVTENEKGYYDYIDYLIDINGQPLVSRKSISNWSDIDKYRFVCGLSKFEKFESNYRCGLLDKKLDTILPAIYEKIIIDKESKTIFAVLSSGKSRIFDTKGLLIVDSIYLYSYFYEGVAWAKQNELVGLINREGKFLIEPQFDFSDVCDGCYRFENGVSWVQKTNKLGLVSNEGTIIIEPRFDEVHSIFTRGHERPFIHFSEGMAFAFEGEKMYLVKKNGEIIPTLFSKDDFKGDIKFVNGIADIGGFRINKKGEVIVKE